MRTVFFPMCIIVFGLGRTVGAVTIDASTQIDEHFVTKPGDIEIDIVDGASPPTVVDVLDQARINAWVNVRGQSQLNIFGGNFGSGVQAFDSSNIVAEISAQEAKFDPTSGYKQESIEGFTVLLHPDVLKHKEDAWELRKELESQLKAIVSAVPVGPLSDLQQVRIWVEWEARMNGAAEFHPSAVWLKENGYNPEKAGCVEVSNTRNFVKWSRAEQPWMILHELAHAYHHLVLGEHHEGIMWAYHQAVDRKSYQSVDYVHGGKQKAYALTNAKEYFAELSEAYFGKNDFYPLHRAELERYDPVGYELMERTWGKPKNAERKDK